MRFAYIDSQGREVNIPSVDALRLRIELGAIKDSTEFFDANSGKWAPAAEHEIFRTLQRELEDLESGGFVPPPPVPETPLPAEPEPAPPEIESAFTPPDAPAEDAPDVPDDGGLGGIQLTDAPEPAPEPPSDDFGLGFDVSLSDDVDFQAGAEIPGSDLSGADLTEASLLDADLPEADEAAGPPLGEADLGLEGMDDLDLGSAMEAGLEGAPPMESGPMEEAVQAGLGGEGPGMSNLDELASMEISDEWGETDEPEMPGDEVDHDPATADMGDLDLAPVTGEESWSPPPPPPEDMGLSLEEPLSEFDADQPPDWMQNAGPGAWAEGGDEAGVAAPPPPDRGEPPPRPRGRSRSGPPQRKLRKASTPGLGRVALLALVVAVVGVGGWYGYNTFLVGGPGGGGPAGPELPALDPLLMPQMRELAGAAGERAVEALAALPAREQLPEPPSQEWLGGDYLANASEYPGIAQYWEGMLAYVTAVEANADTRFEAALDDQIQAAEIPAPEADPIRARALAGWNAAGPDRQRVFDQLRQVATTSLDLHQFLMANEDQIDEPQGVSEDRVLEAVPATEALREAMRDRVLAITLALDNLGYLDQITTDALLGTFLDKVADVPIR